MEVGQTDTVPGREILEGLWKKRQSPSLRRRDGWYYHCYYGQGEGW